jgi:citronellyl-CoA dehydrogenase
VTDRPLIPALAADLAPATFARAKAFAVEHVRPFALAWDEAAAFPRSLFCEAGRQGLLGLRLPADVGGQGKSWNDTAAYVEALSYGESGGAAMGLLAQSELTLPLFDAQLKGKARTDLVSAAVRGEKVLALALSEPQAGSDLAMTACTAKKVGDGYVIDGEKKWITNGGIADVLLLAARTGSGPRDLSLFALATKTPGFAVVETIAKIGNLSADTGHLKMKACATPESSRLGAEGEGFRLATKNFLGERLVMAIYVTACMGRSLEAAVAYTGEREAFGQRVLDFQVWRHRFADHVTTYLAARALVREALAAAVKGQLDSTAVTAAKLFCTQNAVRVIDDCLQSFGGVGYTPGCAVARMWRDVRLYTIGGGSSEIMREILARSL